MNLYLVQHGLAESATENSGRPLTEKGIEQTRTAARSFG